MGEQRVENLVLLWSRITFQALSSFFFHRWLSLKSLSKLHGKITLFGFLFYINNQFLTVASCPLKSQKKKKYQDISVGDTVVHISTALGDIFPVREKQSAALKSSSFFLLWMQQSEGLSSLLSVYLIYIFFSNILNGPISNRSPRWKCEINPSDTGNVPSAMLGTFSSLSLTLASLPLEAAQPEAVKYKNTLHIYHSRSSNNVIVCGRTRIWRSKQSRAAS